MKDIPNSQVLTGLRAVIADKENELGLLRGTLAILSQNPTVTLESVIAPVPAKPVKTTTAAAIAPVKKAKANVMSDEGRARVSEAQRKRWAKIKREQRATAAKAAAKKPVIKAKAAAKPAPKPSKPAPKLPAKPMKQPMKPAAVKAVRMSDSIPAPASAA